MIILNPSRIDLGSTVLVAAASLAAYGWMCLAATTSARSAPAPQPPDELAMAIPGIHGEIALPRPLSSSDVARIKAIFAAQADGDNAAADRLLGALEDTSLIGTILADRCTRVPSSCSSAELQDWLARYSDLPASAALSRILAARAGGAVADTAPPDRLNDDADATSAPVALPATQSISRLQALYARGQDQAALHGALAAVAGNDLASGATFYGGLAAWRLGQPGLARSLFAMAAKAHRASNDVRAAAAWWASRTAQSLGDRAAALDWLSRSAVCGNCFYGAIARHMLARSGALLTANDRLTIADLDAVMATAAGRRACALIQVDQPELARAELRAGWGNAKNAAERRAFGLTARAAGLIPIDLPGADTAADIPGGSLEPPAGFAPTEGFTVDPALIYGIVSIESRFKPTVVSRSGARGLMQLMPRTAAHFGNRRPGNLSDPGQNLSIGQRYLVALAQDSAVRNDLIRVLAAYAVGNEGMSHWGSPSPDGTDSLAFLEAIPKRPVREWIKTVLLHSWIYAQQLGSAPQSLDQLASGETPTLPLSTAMASP